MPKLSQTTILFLILIAFVIGVGVVLTQRMQTLETTIRTLSDAILQIKSGSELVPPAR